MLSAVAVLECVDGASCLLELEVTARDGYNTSVGGVEQRRSWNTLPFHAPKGMRLPVAAVTATVGRPVRDPVSGAVVSVHDCATVHSVVSLSVWSN